MAGILPPSNGSTSVSIKRARSYVRLFLSASREGESQAWLFLKNQVWGNGMSKAEPRDESLFTREVNNVPVLPKSPYRDILPMVFKVHLFRSKKSLWA